MNDVIVHSESNSTVLNEYGAMQAIWYSTYKALLRYD